jgi:Fanconi anemia group M protein
MGGKAQPPGVVIVADHREAASGVVKHLSSLNALVKAEQLEVGDYVLSDRVAVERKTASDFTGSVADGRVFGQLERLAKSYESPVLLVEGSPEMLFGNGLHPNSVRGALSSIAVDLGVPMIWSRNPKETAAQLYWIAKREQHECSRPVQLRSFSMDAPLHKHQEFLVSGLPNVNTVIGRRLLERFGSPAGVFAATEDELRSVDGIGEIKARRIREMLDSAYEKKDG